MAWIVMSIGYGLWTVLIFLLFNGGMNVID